MKIPLCFLITSLFIPTDATIAAATLSADALKRVLSHNFSCDCGVSIFEPEFLENQKLIQAAGADIVPVLAELLPDPNFSPYFIRTSARAAGKYPFSEPFRAALRLRRDDLTLAPLGVFDYFVKFGDRSDLKWMEAAVRRIYPEHRQYAAQPIQQLRKRLPVEQTLFLSLNFGLFLFAALSVGGAGAWLALRSGRILV